MTARLEAVRRWLSAPPSHPDDLRARHTLKYAGAADRHTTVLCDLEQRHASIVFADYIDISGARRVNNRRKITPKITQQEGRHRCP
jgi:hypothetical protein